MTETSIWDKSNTESYRLMRGAFFPQRIHSRAPHRTNSRLRRNRPLQRIDLTKSAKAHSCAKQGGTAILIALESFRLKGVFN